MPPGPRVLVVRFSSLGDVVLTTPLLRAIRSRYPAALVTVVVQARYADVLASNPAVNAIVAVEPREPVAGIARRLAPAAYDARLDLQDSPGSRRLRRTLGGAWGVADRRRAARLLLIWLGLDTYGAYVPVAERYFTAAGALDVRPDGAPPEVFPTAEDEARAAALLPHDCVALAPGARWASKRWPAVHWRALADRLLARGFSVVAVGRAEERAWLAGPGIAEAYGLPLRTTAAVLRRARVVVANDSGLLHLATAVRRPVIALMGPTVPAFGYLPYGVPAQVLERPLACRPCSPSGSDHCPLGHHRCMIELEPEAVAAAVERAA
ncbi:MAG: glycosyltransferase family 9 protein [Gemmatimonadetes bacterium]|nr:glycosyltransferase family 9 protein [Gemmatimonadota bacterium]